MKSTELGSKIRTLRELKGMTQTDLSRKTGISQQSIAKWESGASVPRPSNLLTLSIALGVTTQDLLDPRSIYVSPLARINEARTTLAERAEEIKAAGEEVVHNLETNTVNRINVPRMPPRFPPGAVAHREHYEKAAAFEQEILKQLRQFGLNPKYEAEVRVGPISYRVDFALPGLLVEVLYLPHSNTLGNALLAVTHRAWKLAVLRAGRSYELPRLSPLLIIAMPENEELVAHSAYPRAGNIRRRKFEAALLGVDIEEVNSAAAAAKMIIDRVKSAQETETEQTYSDEGEDLI